MFFLFESRVLPEDALESRSQALLPRLLEGLPREQILAQLAATLNLTQAARCQQLCQCHGKFVPGKRGLGSSHRSGSMTHSGDQRQQLRVECKADPEVHSPGTTPSPQVTALRLRLNGASPLKLQLLLPPAGSPPTALPSLLTTHGRFQSQSKGNNVCTL